MSLVVAFDQSVKHSACAILQWTSTGGFSVPDTMVFSPGVKGIAGLYEIRCWVNLILDQNATLDLVVREMHNQRQFGAATQLHAVNCIIDMQVWDHAQVGRLLLVPSTRWKKICLGSGNVKKDTGYLMRVNKFLQKTLRIPHEINDDNVADAICLAFVGILTLMHKNKIEWPHYSDKKVLDELVASIGA